MADMIKVGVLGAKGRMGSQICAAVAAEHDMTLAAGVDVGDDREALSGCDVVVDFTHPGAVMDNLRWCVGQGLDTVVGTSGERPLTAAILGSTPHRLVHLSKCPVLVVHA